MIHKLADRKFIENMKISENLTKTTAQEILTRSRDIRERRAMTITCIATLLQNTTKDIHETLGILETLKLQMFAEWNDLAMRTANQDVDRLKDDIEDIDKHLR